MMSSSHSRRFAVPYRFGTTPLLSPRSRRDAIPDQELSAGRVLMLDCVDASASRTEILGRHAISVCARRKPGKLTGAFDVIADVDLEAAEGLVALLQSAIDQARRQRRSWDAGPLYVRKRKP